MVRTNSKNYHLFFLYSKDLKEVPVNDKYDGK